MKRSLSTVIVLAALASVAAAQQTKKGLLPEGADADDPYALANDDAGFARRRVGVDQRRGR